MTANLLSKSKMKKLYLLTILLLTLSYSNVIAQFDCLTAIPVLPGTNILVPSTPYWYSYNASGNSERITISSLGSGVDTHVLVYDGCGGELLAINDDFGGTSQSSVTLNVTPNQTIYINWANTNSSLGFSWSLTVDSPQTFFWVGGEGAWSDINHWANTSGGAGGGTDYLTPPTAIDDVFFDSNSFPTGGTLNVDIDAYCNNMEWTDGSTNPQFFAPSNVIINLYGNLIMVDGIFRDVFTFSFWSSSSNVLIDLADNKMKLNSTITWNGRFWFYSGSYSLESSFHADDLVLFNSANFTTNNNAVDLESQLSINGGTTFTAGNSLIALKFLSASGMFNQGTSTVIFDKGDGTLSGISTFNNVTLEAGAFTFSGNHTIDDLKLLPDVKLELDTALILTIVSDFQAIGTRSQMVDIKSTIAGTPTTIALGSANALVNFVILRDNTVTATPTPVIASNSIDNGNNLNWNIAPIAPLSYFWVGGAGNWSDAGHWATTDGGTIFRTDPPGPVDNVNFTSNSFPSGGKLTIDIPANCDNMIWTDSAGVTNPSIGNINDHPLTVRGNFQLALGVTRDISDLRFESVSDNDITFADNQLYTASPFGSITFDGTGSWSLQDSLSSYFIHVNGGTLNTNNNTINNGWVLFTNGGIVNLGSSIVRTSRLEGNSPALLNMGTSTIYINNRLDAYGQTYMLNDVIIDGDVLIRGNNTFQNITVSEGLELQFGVGWIQTIIQSLNLNGSRPNMVTFKSDFPGSQANVNFGVSAIVNANYVVMQDVTNGLLIPTYGITNAIDNGNNGTGWVFSLITPLNYYWVGGQGNWSDNLNHWSSSDGGLADQLDPPGPLDNIFFTGNSFTAVNDTVTMDFPVVINTMTWQDGSTNPVIDDGPNFNELTITGSLFMVNGVMSSINQITFNSSATNNLIQLGDNLGFINSLWFKGGGTWTALDSIGTNIIRLVDGTFRTNGNPLNTSSFFYWFGDTGSELPILELGNSVMDVFDIVDFPGTGQLIAGSSNIRFTSNGTLSTPSANSLSFNNVDFLGNMTVQGSNTFNSINATNPGSTINLQAGFTTTINNQLTILGAQGDPIVLISDTPGNAAILSSVGASITADNVHITDNTATGGANFFATNASDFGNVTGWTGLQVGQTIDFTTSDVQFSDGAITLSGSTNSGLSIQYTLLQGDATLAGDVLTPNSSGLVGVQADQEGDVTYGEALAVTSYIHFNATTDANELGNMKKASYVIGQEDFESNVTFYDVNKTPGARKSFVSKDGKLFTSSRRRVLIWNQVPDQANVPADVVLGQPDFISSGVNVDASTLYINAYSIGITNDGRLLVADFRGILIWNTVPTVSGTPADVIIGQDDFTSNEQGAEANRFNGTSFFLITPDEKLIVSDLTGGRVLIFNQIPTTNGASADIVIGQPDFGTNDPGDGPFGMNWPAYSVMDAAGKLYIPDAQNNRVLVYNSVPTTNGVAADYVLGQPDLDSNTAGTTSTLYNFPYSVDISRTGKMAVADRGNNRVLIYNTVPADNSIVPDYVLGQPDLVSAEANFGEDLTGRGLNIPYAVYWDAAENLFVGDLVNNRYLVWGTPDITPPDITDFTVPQPYIANSGVNAVMTLDEVSGLQQANAMFRFISSPDQTFISTPLVEQSENVWSFDLTGIDLQDERLGIEFYVDIMDGYGNTLETSTTTLSTNIGYSTGLPITNFGVGNTTESYRMFSVPLTLQMNDATTVFDEILDSGYDKTELRLFSFTGGTGNTYQEYGSGFTNIDLGKGYFALAATSASVLSGNGQTPVVDANNPFTIDLVPGFNLIGNPYNFNVVWADVLAASGLSIAEPVTYTAGSYQTLTSISSGLGVFVNNPTGSTVTLEFPIARNTGGRIAELEDNTNSLASSSWEVRFLQENNLAEQIVLGAVGMEENALLSFDEHDRINPPPFAESAKIEFNHPEFFQPSFKTDIRLSSNEEQWAFTFEAPANPDLEEISWDNSYYGYDSPDIYLVDKTHFIVINMKEVNNYQFKHSGVTKFEVFYGYNAFEDLLPDHLEIQTPFPNPFNDKVTINIGLPNSSENHKVSVAIYNTMGAQVATLNNAEMESGYHSFSWQGTNDSGHEVPNGIYAYRIIVNGGISEVVAGKVIKE